MRRILFSSDLVIFLALTGVGTLFIWYRPAGLDAGAAAGLSGALYGAAAVLLGNWINRWNEANRTESAQAIRTSKVKKLITARLVYVATSLIRSKELADAAVTSEHAPHASDLLEPFPDTPTIVRDVGADITLLDEAAIDALVTLESNIDTTRRDLESRAVGPVPIISHMLGLPQVVQGVAIDLEMLARCFERIDPARKFTVPNEPTELASTVLRRKAKLPQQGHAE